MISVALMGALTAAQDYECLKDIADTKQALIDQEKVFFDNAFSA